MTPAETEPAFADPRLIAGIAAYRRHPWQRAAPPVPTLWSEGASRLCDYGGSGPTVVFVPSLVNRSYVLDLLPDRSMLRWLALNGMRVLLLDWGWPDDAALRFTLTDYVVGRLSRALDACGTGPVSLVGYCMGGLLALAAALWKPERVRSLALLATPWDFHAAGTTVPHLIASILPLFEPVMALGGAFPVDGLQSLFGFADGDAITARFRAFADVDPASDRARGFVALEDWLSDGVPLAAAVARECLGGWYGENTPARGRWCIAGLPVDPAAWRKPTFVALPARDRIVPPASAQPLATLIAGAVAHFPRAGHVGMAAGSTAEAALWRPLAEWLRTASG